MGWDGLKSWQKFCVAFVLPIILAIIGAGNLYLQNSAAKRAEHESNVNNEKSNNENKRSMPSSNLGTKTENGIRNDFGIINNGDEVLLNIVNDRVIILNANAGAKSSGDFRSVISVQIYVNGEECGSDQSYVPNNWKITHFVNASCIESVSQGDLRIKFAATGAGTSAISSHGSYMLVDR